MIILTYDALAELVNSFLSANYSTGTDINTSTPIYFDELFDPRIVDSFSRLKKSAGYSVVINGESWTNLTEHPHSHLKKELTANIHFVYSTGNMWDTANRWVRVLAGSVAAPLMNSMQGVVGNFEKHVRTTHIDKNSVTSYWQDIVNISTPIVHDGKWVVTTCELRALFMESKTITVTPV